MVVMEMKLNKATVRIHDDAYVNASQKEIQTRIRTAQRIAEGIIRRAAERGDPRCYQNNDMGVHKNAEL